MIRVLLTCGHQSAPYPLPRVQDRTWCDACDDMRTVTEILSFRVACDMCRFQRVLGYARITAELAADRHYRKNPTHLVKVFMGSTEVSRRNVAETHAETLWEE